MSESWVKTAGHTPYKLNLQIDEAQLFEREENGRIIQYYKGENGARIITHLGRSVKDLESLKRTGLFKDITKGEKKSSEKRDGLNDRVTLTQNVTLKNSVSVTKTPISVTSKKAVCALCEKTYTPKRKSSKYCSTACRVKASRV